MSANYQQGIQAVIDLLSKHPTRPYSLDELASHCHISKYHFHRLFKAITGETVHQLSHRIRLEKAASRLIYSPKIPITEIAFEFGFSNSANFSKAFQQHYSNSPSAYRKNLKRGMQLSKIGKVNSTQISNNSASLIGASSIEIKNHHERRLACLRGHGAYEASKIKTMFAVLIAWAREKHVLLEQEPLFLVNWSDTFIAEQDTWIYDAGVVVTDNCKGNGDIQIQGLIGGLVAEALFWIDPKDFQYDLQKAWDSFIVEWLIDSNYQLSHNPSFECYGGFNDQGQQAVTLCLPLETLN